MRAIFRSLAILFPRVGFSFRGTKMALWLAVIDHHLDLSTLLIEAAATPCCQRKFQFELRPKKTLSIPPLIGALTYLLSDSQNLYPR